MGNSTESAFSNDEKKQDAAVGNVFALRQLEVSTESRRVCPAQGQDSPCARKPGEVVQVTGRYFALAPAQLRHGTQGSPKLAIFGTS